MGKERGNEGSPSDEGGYFAMRWVASLLVLWGGGGCGATF